MPIIKRGLLGVKRKGNEEERLAGSPDLFQNAHSGKGDWITAQLENSMLKIRLTILFQSVKITRPVGGAVFSQVIAGGIATTFF